MAQIIEFKSKTEYDRWLQTMGVTIRIINVSTTKRWSPWTGYLGDTKTYSVTYEKANQPSATGSYCVKCGAANPQGSNFCSKCGTRMSER